VDSYPELAPLQAMIDLEEHSGARALQAEAITDYRFGEPLRQSGLREQLPRWVGMPGAPHRGGGDRAEL
jgi:hypothetical protein